MKPFLKLSITIFALFCVAGLFAQDRNLVIRRALIDLKSDKSDYETKRRAWNYISTYGRDSVEAMYALGECLLRGVEVLNIRQDVYLGRRWLEAASLRGHAESSNILSSYYYRGNAGVEQNFETAFHYAQKAAESGDPLFVHRLGHFYERGYGCEQSYAIAFKCYQYAADRNIRGAMLALGLFYRNGYGVERDTAIANSWFAKAKKLGHPLVDVELAEAPERPLEVIQVTKLPDATASKRSKSASRKPVKHSIRRATDIEGDYTGALITYDWSGEYPLKESFLDVTFEQSGKDIVVKWVEEDAAEVEALATLTDSALVFHKAKYFKKALHDRGRDRIGDEFTEWRFEKAALNYVNEGGQIVLSGHLQLYSLRDREPGRPMYMVLQPKQPQPQEEVLTIKEPISDVNPETKRLVFASQVLVYPNPFVDYLNLSFSLEEQNSCMIQIYSVSGVLVWEQRLGVLEPGVHRYQMNTSNYAKGSYILRLICGDQSYSHTLIR
ncbi:MAG: T9SS type A sorting domain-containing protein [Bacteroidales bacterium]|jgi:hypothetical protein|nr:T9SS type A sorting domain-containing protein [Bacteroidales bacterium]